MRKEKELSAMKKFIKKMAIAVLTGAIAFSVVPATVQAAGWKQNKNGYWWQENDYSYPKNQWKTIYGKQYHFNSKGYMDTDWTKVDGKWYYFGGKNDGAKKTYWQKVRGKYYWLGSNGVMRTGWQNVYGKYYWLGSSNEGAMKTGWQKIGGSDYYFGRTGESNEGVLRTSTWVGNYYVDSSGRWDKYKKIDTSNYMLNGKYKNLVSDLGMQVIDKKSNRYKKDKVELYWMPGDCFGVTNEGTSFVNVYGIVPGDSLNRARSILVNKGWTEVNGYSSNSYNYVFLKKIDERLHMVEFDTNSRGILQNWDLRNGPQGEWVLEYYSIKSENAVVMESPQQESDTTETEIPDTEANSEEPALPETTEQETSDATQNENNTTEIEEEQATQEEQVSEEESTEETQQVEENKEENQSSEMINE